MYIEGSTAACVLYLLGFLSCGFLGLIAWSAVNAVQAKLAVKLLEEYLEELRSEET